MTGDAGFTLIEALAAMAVLAVGSAGLIRATEAHIDSIRSVELRGIAGWVAENRLVEDRLSGSAAPVVSMLGHDWRVTTKTTLSDDPDIVAVEISVGAPGGARPLATLRGFRDTKAVDR